MMSIRKYLRYLVSSPKLYRIYPPPRPTTSPSPGEQQQEQEMIQDLNYTPSIVEGFSDIALSFVFPMSVFLTIYNRKLSYLQFTVLLYVTTRFLQGVSRLTNPCYREFLNILENANSNPENHAAIELLRSYDFEFSHFPVLFSTLVTIGPYTSRQGLSRGLMWYVSWVVAHSFGIRLIYPGVLLGWLLRSVLEDGRARLVTERKGKRVKIRSSSEYGSVDVDAIVLDRRNRGGKGNTLVLCCEGNAGFYEIGMIGGALSEGYSAMGWNHPGFGGSSGTPYPVHELTAAMGVMEYAVNVLGFKESEIIVYGWSIGGFPASYIASQYPRIKGLILDATFDTVLPLAIPRMPAFLTNVTIATIKSHVNLDNLANLSEYRGPIRIVRRTDDEIIGEPNDMPSNRGNFLLLQLVLDRYGSEVTENSRNALIDWINVPHDKDQPPMDCLSGDVIKSSSGVEQSQVLIAIASSILRDFKTTHCTPLPKEYFRIK